jgi:hypothetical protein
MPKLDNSCVKICTTIIFPTHKYKAIILSNILGSTSHPKKMKNKENFIYHSRTVTSFAMSSLNDQKL